MLLGLTLNPGWAHSSFCPGAAARPRACPASEHGHPQLGSASVSGISGRHRVGVLGLGSPGGCSVPSTLNGRVLAPTDFCPHRGSPVLAKGPEEVEKGDGSAPAQPPCPWAVAGGGPEPRLGGVPAAQQECNQSRWCR